MKSKSWQSVHVVIVFKFLFFLFCFFCFLFFLFFVVCCESYLLFSDMNSLFLSICIWKVVDERLQPLLVDSFFANIALAGWVPCFLRYTSSLPPFAHFYQILDKHNTQHAVWKKRTTILQTFLFLWAPTHKFSKV